MRRAMICVSVMLAVLQLWPLVFGQNSANQAAQSPPVPQKILSSAPVAPHPAVFTEQAKLANNFAPVSEKMPVINCDRRYRQASAACAPRDGDCRMRATDKWDVCDARGFWSE